MRGTAELSYPTKGNNLGGVHLWPGKFEDYDVDVVPVEGAPYTRTVNTTSYAHARRVVLGEVGPRDRVLNREFNGD